MANCPICGQGFVNAFQLGVHARSRQCNPVELDAENLPVELDAENLDANPDVNPNLITQPFSLWELARRPTGEWGRIANVHIVHRQPLGTPRDYREVSLLVVVSACYFLLVYSFFVCTTVAAYVA